jgi:hypothetical protein
MARRKKQQLRARPKNIGGDRQSAKRDLVLTVEGLEVARGYDGFLRGTPEPALLVAAFGKPAPVAGSLGSAAAPPRLLGRALSRFTLDGPPPCRCAAPAGTALRVRIRTPMRVLLLVVALEEDGGEDVARSYARFEDLRMLTIWDGRSAIPDPCPVADLFEATAWSASWAEGMREESEMIPVRVMAGGQDIGDACARDDYIASVALRLEIDSTMDRAVRAHTVSADEKNDWTALVRIAVR